MNDLKRYFENNKTNERFMSKWDHYLDIYDQYLSKYRNKPVVILEIGIFQGGSLKLWKEYFGPKAQIFAVDVNPDCKKYEEEGVTIFIGSQSDRNFLKKIKETIPPLDILIDDGGHMMDQQIVTFEEMYSHIKEDGIYLCEDCHTSYYPHFGGDYKKKDTYIEYTKNFIDYINAWHSKNPKLTVSDFTKSTKAVHYYDSVVVLEKKPIPPPTEICCGIRIPLESELNPPQKRGLFGRLKSK